MFGLSRSAVNIMWDAFYVHYRNY